MKKIFCTLGLLCALLFAGCDVEEMSSLRDISRPYAGEYKCQKLSLGGEDMLSRFDYLKLDLRASGDFTLKYADTEEGKGEYSGKYEMKEDAIIFRADAGGEEKSYPFRYEKGAVIIELPFGGKLLLAEFRTG